MTGIEYNHVLSSKEKLQPHYLYHITIPEVVHMNNFIRSHYSSSPNVLLNYPGIEYNHVLSSKEKKKYTQNILNLDFNCIVCREQST